MNKKIIVLGAGMVGKAIIYDLSKKYNVTAADINKESLTYCKDKLKVETVQMDISNLQKVKELIKNFDMVVSAVPGFMGLETVRCAIKEGKDVVDISFMPEDFMQLDSLAKENNVTVIADCGVAPGMPNIIVGYCDNEMKIEEFEYMVGGLPKERKFPFEYKAPFSPIDVLEEYTRPARMLLKGEIINNPAMSDPELIYFDKLGHLEAFNTDGLRSLLYTMSHIPNMKEKTLRYRGHINLIKALKASGFFSEEKIKINNIEISPLDMTIQVLFKEWKLLQDEEEFTVMRVRMKGIKDNKKAEIIYDLYDEYNKETGLSSMARTTGFTATAAANLINEGIFKDKGVFPPESIGKNKKNFEYIINHLKERGVIYKKTVNQL